MLELLQHPILELLYTLKDLIAVFTWEYSSYCGIPILEQLHIPYDGVAMFAQC